MVKKVNQSQFDEVRKSKAKSCGFFSYMVWTMPDACTNT